MIRISVIVPIYNVAGFIERCVCSLMEQTLDDVEYIFVDDASPDNSVAVLENTIARYPNRKEYIKILHHEVNLGLPAARNTGLSVSRGEYIYHCDSDDFVEHDMLELMYEAAKDNDADFVWSDWFLSYSHKERYMKQPDFKTSFDVLKGMLLDAMKYNVWNKLVKRSIYIENNILFPTGHSMGEDMTMIRLAACTERVAYVNRAFYHYVQVNTNAMTQSFNDRSLTDLLYNVVLTLKFLKEKSKVDLVKEEACFKLNVKLPFLISPDWDSYRRWGQWFPDANRYIMENKYISLRTRVLEWLAARKFYAGVWIYYMIVYRFLYSILYKR